jgi:stress response protein YsnF
MIKDEPSERDRTDRVRDAEVATIPLVEERLHVGKREVESGRVRIRVDVNEREERVIQDLERDEVTIERVPRNERLSEIRMSAWKAASP